MMLILLGQHNMFYCFYYEIEINSNKAPKITHIESRGTNEMKQHRKLLSQVGNSVFVWLLGVDEWVTAKPRPKGWCMAFSR